MESLQGWATGLCYATLAAAVLRKLAPEKGCGTLFRVLLSAFFICAFLAPFLSSFSFSQALSLDLLPDELEQSVLEDTVTAQLQDAVRQAAEEVARSALSQQGIAADKIEVFTDTAADGSIYIAQVEVTLAARSSGKRAQARETLVNRLETAVLVKEADT